MYDEEEKDSDLMGDDVLNEDTDFKPLDAEEDGFSFGDDEEM